MPNRILKDSICTSDSIDQLSWFEEVLFYRLIVNCDDYGRYDGRIAVIKNKLFPLRDSLTAKQVSEAVDKLASIGLVALYEVGGKPFLYLPTWNDHQSVRAKRSKYPDPSEGCKSMKTSACKCIHENADVPVIQSNTNSNIKDSARAREGYVNYADLPLEDLVSDPVLADAVRNWIGYKDAKGQPYVLQSFQALISEVKAKAKKYGVEATVEIINTSMSSGYDGIIWNKLEKQETNKKQSGRTKNQFNNIEQHDYDFAEIERQILG